jgi:Uma2 family endonuclease
MTIAGQITTARQLLQATGLGRCELVRGELVMLVPAGPEHGWIAANVTAALVPFVKQGRLGRVFGAETGFQIGSDPDTVRAPDVAFVAAERLGPTLTQGFFKGAPDLAVEVVSPNDRASAVLAKVQDWLDAGCRLVWVVDPQTRTLTVYRSRQDVTVLRISDTLTAANVLPGFSLPVAEIFT